MYPVNYCEYVQTGYTQHNELIKTLRLSGLELTILNYCMNGTVKSEIMAELGIGRGTLYHRKASIRRRYQIIFNAY